MQIVHPQTASLESKAAVALSQLRLPKSSQRSSLPDEQVDWVDGNGRTVTLPRLWDPKAGRSHSPHLLPRVVQSEPPQPAKSSTSRQVLRLQCHQTTINSDLQVFAEDVEIHSHHSST